MSSISIISSVLDQNKTTLTFIKRYNRYYHFLLFLPRVIANMIFDYINDMFEISFNHTERTISINTCIILNYESIFIRFSCSADDIFIPCIQEIVCKHKLVLPCDYTCVITYFMKKYYNKQLYLISQDPDMCHTTDCTRSEYNDIIINFIDNHKHFKNEIIIIEKIINYIRKTNDRIY